MRAKTSLSVAVALFHGTKAAPAELSKEILAELTARNLRPKLVPVDALGTRRTTGQRLAALSAAAGEAELLVLVETDASFYSALNGRYRWTVGSRMTMARRGQLSRSVHQHYAIVDAIAGVTPRRRTGPPSGTSAGSSTG